MNYLCVKKVNMIKHRALISYAYESTFDWDYIADVQDNLDLCVDSGAFTAFTKKKVVKLSDYQKFLDTRMNFFKDFKYFSLDVIGDAEKTLQNYRKMYQSGFRPIPIFTVGAPKEHLDYYYEMSNIVALGGIAVSWDGREDYIKTVMNTMVEFRKVHWLGYANDQMLKAFRPASYDMRTWMNGQVYGTLKIYTMGKFVDITRQQYPKVFRKYQARLKRLGIDPLALLKEINWRGGFNETKNLAQKATATSYLAYANDLLKRINVMAYFVHVSATFKPLNELINLLNTNETF